MSTMPHGPRPLPLTAALLLSLLGCSGDDPWGDGLPLGSGTWAVHTVCGKSGTTTPGIDVSKWQGTVDWHKVKAAGMVFGVARVSDGLKYPDAYFAQNWKQMKQVGIIRSVYQFFRPDQSATDQANYLIAEVNKAGGFQAGDLPPVLDLEATGNQSPSTIVSKIDTWLSLVEKGTGRRPIIYTGSYFWDGKVLSGKHTKHPLWTAHYTSASCPLVPNPWNKWHIWQYTSSGKVSGVSGNCDMNRFDGTVSDLKAFAAASVVNPPPKPDQGVPPKPDQGVPPKPDRGVTPPQPDAGAPVRRDGGKPPTPDKRPPGPRDSAPGPTSDSGGSVPPLYAGPTTALAGGCTVGRGDPTALTLAWLTALLLIRRRQRRAG